MKNPKHEIMLFGKNLQFLVNHCKIILFILMVLILGLPLLLNLINQEPPIKGTESYYHLTQSAYAQASEPHYYLLNILSKLLPEMISGLLPFLLAIGSFFLYFVAAQKFKIDASFTFTFLILIILSPFFIVTFSTLSLASLSIFLFLSGLALLVQEQKILRYLAFVPFSGIALLDISSIVVLLTFLFFHFRKKRNNYKEAGIIAGIPVLLFLLTLWTKTLPFAAGPVNSQMEVITLISDFGGVNGISFFVILLAIIGISINWKQQDWFFPYLLLVMSLVFYVISTKTLLFLVLSLTYFATLGFVTLFSREWNFAILKRFTILLLVLGILFSTTTFLERINDYSPTAEEKAALVWIRDHTNQNEVLYTTPENRYYVSYFAERQVVTDSQIEKSLSIDELFPLLQEQKVRMLYLTQNAKEELEQGRLLFLLKNERFKLVYSTEEVEVWEFRS